MKITPEAGSPRSLAAYPYLGVWPDGTVVLFTEPRTGVQLLPSTGVRTNNLWNEAGSKPYGGKIVLENGL